MKIANLFLFLGTLAAMPELAKAERWNYGRPNYPRPNFSYNDWNRPGRHYQGYGYGYGSRYGHDGYSYSNPDPRVRYGIQTGQLSRNELQELRDRQREISQERQSYWSDGYLSKNERKDLERDQRNYDKFLNHNLRDGERSNRNWFSRWW